MSSHPLRFILSAAVLVAVGGAARASTTITGGNIINQKWTVAGSPYVVQGDITIPSDSFLIVEAGVEVQVASGDLQAAGQDKNRVEITVDGTLDIIGTSTQPATVRGQSTSPGSWWGIVANADAVQVDLEYATVADAQMGVTSAAAGQALSTKQVTFSNNGTGIYVTGGAPTLDSFIAEGNTLYGVDVSVKANVTLSNCLIRGNSVGIVYGDYSATTTQHIANCTIHKNTGYGIRVYYADKIIVSNTLVTQNGSTGICSEGPGISLLVQYSDVWGNQSPYCGGVGVSTGVLATNPLYVSDTDLHLTSNSPARFSALGGGYMGVFPYSGVATPGLYGTLWTNLELGAAGSPYVVPGDLDVAPGVTLTIDPGVTVTFGSGDVMKAGSDPARTELTVDGTLAAVGSAANAVVFRGASATAGSWNGVVVHAAAPAAKLQHATIRDASDGVLSSAAGQALTISDVVFSNNTTAIDLVAGSPKLDAFTVVGSTGLVAVLVESTASATLSNCIIQSGMGYGIELTSAPGIAGPIQVINCTVDSNLSIGIYAKMPAGAGVTVSNSVVTKNGLYGLDNAGSGSVNLAYSDVWGNDYASTPGVTTGAGVLSVDPQYVSSTDLHVMSSSPCIDLGTTGLDHDRDAVKRPLDGNYDGGVGWDLGAYEYAPPAVCGNGVIDNGEACDDGMHNGQYGYCNATCTALGPRCGDGVTNGPEQCDDGNVSNADACLNSCKVATCGDGYVHVGVEACDDGNASNADACLNTCKTASCGDGYVHAGVEACDDGNASDADGCLDTCAVAACGDGYVHAGVEACDDGNLSNTDACLITCKMASCGDGFTWAGHEQCDDDNTMNGDGCSSTCALEGMSDAGVPDGGTYPDARPDGGTYLDARPDGGTYPDARPDAVDAGVPRDALVGPDGATIGDDDAGARSGCGCQGAGSPGGGTLLLAAVAAALRRRSRTGDQRPLRSCSDRQRDRLGA